MAGLGTCFHQLHINDPRLIPHPALLCNQRRRGVRKCSEMIACAPLHSAHFRADSQRVHQLLKNYLVAKTAKQWIKPLEQHANGHHNMLAFREHHQGEGNASRCIALAKCMRENLHYKNERSLAFSIFLD